MHHFQQPLDTTPNASSHLTRTHSLHSQVNTLHSLAVATQGARMPEAHITRTSATLTFDNNGNVTTDDLGHSLSFDAWNRLVAVRDGSGNLIKAYTYDGLGRRITDSNGVSKTDLYYSTSWQVLEDRINVTSSSNGTVDSQYVWSPFYVDALVYRNSSNWGSYYAMYDATFGVTGIEASGTVAERFPFNSYGKRVDLESSWSASSDTKGWLYSFQGLRFDAATGLLYARNRDLSFTQMRWIQMDPVGYVDGLSKYGFVGDNPGNRLDGLQRLAITEPRI